jgi:predicted RNA-binding Zn ribbon-like protein
LAEKGAKRLKEQAVLHPAKALAAFKKARDLRELIYRIFLTVTRQQAPCLPDMIVFNAEIKTALNKLSVTTVKAGFEWKWDQIPDAMDCMLWPIIKCAADLLTSGDLHKVKQCAGAPNCGWMFLDTSKNQGRRWCSMDLCGSRDKSHRYYQQKRSAVRIKA